ncbi:DNA adenine methylase [Leuconostoc mesenteroides]|uniref:DNA adenine methylase n=1 Tax=Leuconostoc mesenteroides TaxID=1245 RepID=UPI00235E6EC3|nr:DNA adenine methylase [Leuconostoc mesenteroides]
MLKPLFKYPGGKASEYKYIAPIIPKHATYIEPFLGGGAIFWKSQSAKYVINDFSPEVTAIYKYTQEQNNNFLNTFYEISYMWESKVKYQKIVEQQLVNSFKNENHKYILKDVLSDEFDNSSFFNKYHTEFQLFLSDSFAKKLLSLKKIAQNQTVENFDQNALGIIGNALYLLIRSIYNCVSFSDDEITKTVTFFFLREFAYSSMFRYNKSGNFNVPFGGNSYAKKSLLTRYEQITDSNVVAKLKETIILTGDFSKALYDDDDTFIFLDPPYDSDFSTYNQHSFDSLEQIRLRDCLLKLKKSKWMLVIKKTDFIEDLYNHQGWFISSFEKQYSVNFKNRNSQSAQHLIITNYEV